MLRRALGSSRLAPAALLSSRAVSTTRYRTTRGGQSGVPFDAVVLQGLGHDGGLFVPETIPAFSAAALEAWRGLSYEDVAYEVMSLYIGPDDIPEPALRDIIRRSYETFRDATLEFAWHADAVRVQHML